MSTGSDTIGVAREHRWMRLAEQRARLKAVSRIVVTLGNGKGQDFGKRATQNLDTLIMLTRPGTIVQLMYAFLLADPVRKRVRGGLRGGFERALKQIEQRGGIVRDVLTGLSTETKDRRRALLLSVSDQIKRSGQGRSSEENGKLSKGRPRQWENPEHRQIIWDEWHSSVHPTNTAAAKEASRRIGKYIGHISMWRIVKEMREAKGLKGKGASGRRPNSTAARIAAEIGTVDAAGPKKPRPKRGVVYFIKNGARDRVKIGFSEGHEGRLASLQSASADKLTLLGTVSGTRKTEMKMHKRFAAYRERGEWFRVEGTLAKFLPTLSKTKRT